MIPTLLFGEALAVGALAMADSRPSVIVATLTVFLIATALTAASDAAAGDLAPTGRRAEVMSSYADWIDMGSAIGPPLAFILADWLGLRMSYGLTAGIALMAGFQFLALWRRERKALPGML